MTFVETDFKIVNEINYIFDLNLTYYNESRNGDRCITMKWGNRIKEEENKIWSQSKIRLS